jgi:hypothetical protein
MVAGACQGGIEVREERMLEMKRAGDLEDAGDRGGFAQGGSDDQGGADVMRVDDVGAHSLD